MSADAVYDDAISALLNLGYQRSAAEKALKTSRSGRNGNVGAETFEKKFTAFGERLILLEWRSSIKFTMRSKML